MDSFLELIKAIIKKNEYSENALKSFITKAEKTFTFPVLDQNNLRLELWKSLYEICIDTSNQQIQVWCCSTVKILSREKNGLNEILEATDWLNLLKSFSGLNDINIQITEKRKLLALEAQKCLCNLAFNSNKAAQSCIENDILYNINERIKLHRNPSFPEEITFFDVKLLFIITAVIPESRSILGKEKNAMLNLIEFLEYILKNEKYSKENSAYLVCEILKALFNLTVHVENEQTENYKKLVKILSEYLLLSSKLEDKFSLQNHIVNLLTNIPNVFYVELITHIDANDSEDAMNRVEYSGYDMMAIKEILELFRAKIIKDNPVGQQLEIISPTATVLYKGACANPAIRKYLRSEILPPLKDFYTRPEEGTTLRNCLCRLLTTPITNLRDIIAEFLFVLCKKSVKRMIKYTGYGNAAGLLAQRGLLGGNEDAEAAEFSSDSEDSETEEYAKIKHNINPVLGCYEPPHPDAMAEMSEEQKEYEAIKIVNLMDALTRKGTIQPCKIDENGKPVPIKHVLELQESLKKTEKFDDEED